MNGEHEPTGTGSGDPQNRIVVRVAGELRPLVAGFLDRRRAEAVVLRTAVSAGDLEAIVDYVDRVEVVYTEGG